MAGARRPAEKPERPSPGKVVGSVTNGIRILKRLGSEARPMRVTEIARELRINPSTCFNILRTLVRERVVVFDPALKSYALGIELLAYLPRNRLRETDVATLRPAMEQLAGDHHVLVTLWRRVADRVVLVLSAEADTPLGIGMPIGCRMPLYLGAVGRVMAASNDIEPAALKESFGRLRWARPPTFRRYLAEIEQARRRGWAVDAGDYAKGLVTLSAPVWTKPGPPDHACSATMFAGQHDQPRLLAIADALTRLGPDPTSPSS